MELSLIEYLENKGFEAEEIVMLERKSMENDSYTNIKKYESIYKIFEFANITDYTINKLIVNNPGLLNKSDLEIIKIAYGIKRVFYLMLKIKKEVSTQKI